MDEKRQTQKELFGEFVKPERKRDPRAVVLPGSKRTITLSYEHLIFIVMTFIVTAALFFSLGVERGKHLKAKGLSLSGETSKQAPVQMVEVPRQGQEGVTGEVAAGKGETETRPKGLPKKEKSVSVYTVQVASYFRKDSAEKEALRLKKKEFEPFVLSSGKFYILCVGEFKNKGRASSEQKKLRKLYPDCYIKRK